MNNKFVYCIVLFFTSSLAASESLQKITVLIKTQCLKTSLKDEIDRYKMLGFGSQFNLDQGLALEGLTQQEKDFAWHNKKAYKADAIVRGEDNYFNIEISPQYHYSLPKCLVVIDDKDNLFYKFIKDEYVKAKNDIFERNVFCVDFLEAKPKSVKIISLALTKEQVKELISLKKSSIMPSVLVGLGVTGLIAALVWYFDFYSKSMALLGRG